MSGNSIFSGKKCAHTLKYLQKRRSCPLKLMGGKGPDKAEIETMIGAASRTPDHGRLFPWYFVVLSGDARGKAGTLLAATWKEDNPDAPAEKLQLEAGKFMRAPVVILVVSRIKRGKHPIWEQILSAGAVCQNLSLAANAMGYGANWLTEWYSYSAPFKTAMGLDEYDHIAGVIYIGDALESPEERDRPDIAEIMTFWDGTGTKLRKGEIYDKDNMDYPDLKFDIMTNKK